MRNLSGIDILGIEFGTTVQSQAKVLLDRFLIRVFEVYRRDWCCFATMPEVLSKLYPYLDGIDKEPSDPWARQLVRLQGGVFVLKDTFFQMFLYRCCDFSKQPPDLSTDLVSLSREFDWSRCFLALQLLPIDSSVTLLRRNKNDKAFRESVESSTGKPKVDALKAAVYAYAEAELDTMAGRLERKQVTQKDFDDAKKKLEGIMSSLPKQDWCTVIIFSRQVIAHATSFDFHFCSKLGGALIQDFGTRERAQQFLNTCKLVAQQMLS